MATTRHLRPIELPLQEDSHYRVASCDFTYDDDDDFLGEGGFAKVFRATMVDTGKRVAAKVWAHGRLNER